jgi:hypothetical protein
VNVINSVLWCVGDEPALVQGMTSYLGLEPKRLQVLRTPFNAVREHACTTPGWTDQANRVSRLQSGRSNHELSYSLLNSFEYVDIVFLLSRS